VPSAHHKKEQIPSKWISMGYSSELYTWCHEAMLVFQFTNSNDLVEPEKSLQRGDNLTA